MQKIFVNIFINFRLAPRRVSENAVLAANDIYDAYDPYMAKSYDHNSRQALNDMRNRFNDNNIDFGNNQHVYKKRAPAPPVSNYSKGPAPQPRISMNYKPSVYTPPVIKSDPIKELERIGRINHEDVNFSPFTFVK